MRTSERLHIRITAEEAAALERAARNRDLPVAEYVREYVPELKEGRKRGRPTKPKPEATR